MAAIRVLGLNAEEPSPFVSLWTMAFAHVSTSSSGSARRFACCQSDSPTTSKCCRATTVCERSLAVSIIPKCRLHLHKWAVKSS